jgi:predicted O-methyltransferase YrrM
VPFTQLADIADRYWCDKGTHGPSSHWSANNYVDIYQAYLQALRKEPIHLLEIGLGVLGPNWDAKIVHGGNAGGASMKMWSDYLPKARITGLDINPAPYLDTDRVKTYVVDQSSRESLAAFLHAHPDPSFDVIVDDGSHRGDHQQISLEMLFPHLKPGGLYFIEDLNDRGYGERTSGRHAAPDAVSTRRFFKAYARDGEIVHPNAFKSTDFLESVSDIMFHSPKPRQRPRDLAVEMLRTAIGRSGTGILRLEWVKDSERLVVLRKSA